MQCHVDFWYQLRICPRTEENHGKPLSNCPVAETSECLLLTSSLAFKYTSSNVVPTRAVALFIKTYKSE
jgi:hypothetical protein